MALWWLWGCYVLPVVMKPEICTFWIRFDLEGQGQSPLLPNNRELNQCVLHLWSEFAGPSLNGWRVTVRTSSKWGKFGLYSYIWPWRPRSIAPQNNRDLNHLNHLNISDPNLVILACTCHELLHGQPSDWQTDRQTDRHTHTFRRRQRQYPKTKTGRG